ncbi:histidine kinase [Flammeovirgaceae bacterium SG7u.111]|nr:histidine kinase [Flammeovirgaceae bacterium SG7u.132]WPO33272.1 histidine kinase [Flammeovirgaceae bacterium SG7u.111]
MHLPTSKSSFSTKELLFQLLLQLVVFLFFSFDKHSPTIEEHKFAYFFNFAIWALVINELILPRFFYKKKYFMFFVWITLIISIIILTEELVLERIYFPETRAKRFPGVFLSLIEVLPMMIILTGFKFAWDALKKQNEVDKLKKHIAESELQFLQSQINPHFLFNNLNNIYSYAIENSPKTPTIILELSAVLRYMLYECKAKFVPLDNEVENLENFTQLNQLQVEDRGEINFHKENISQSYQIAPLILIVFVENAFKHSTASQSDKILIDIAIVLKEDGELHFRCTNSHLPNTNTESLSKGIGLENVKKRLNLLYPNTHTLLINDTSESYEVTLDIQLSKTTV